MTINEDSWRFMTTLVNSWRIMTIHDGSWKFMTVADSSWQFKCNFSYIVFIISNNLLIFKAQKLKLPTEEEKVYSEYLSLNTSVFTDLALWAGLVIESPCLYVCLSVSHKSFKFWSRLKYQVFVFLHKLDGVGPVDNRPSTN